MAATISPVPDSIMLSRESLGALGPERPTSSNFQSGRYAIIPLGNGRPVFIIFFLRSLSRLIIHRGLFEFPRLPVSATCLLSLAKAKAFAQEWRGKNTSNGKCLKTRWTDVVDPSRGRLSIVRLTRSSKLLRLTIVPSSLNLFIRLLYVQARVCNCLIAIPTRVIIMLRFGHI
jgi:hypothetical protein